MPHIKSILSTSIAAARSGRRPFGFMTRGRRGTLCSFKVTGTSHRLAAAFLAISAGRFGAFLSDRALRPSDCAA